MTTYVASIAVKGLTHHLTSLTDLFQFAWKDAIWYQSWSPTLFAQLANTQQWAENGRSGELDFPSRLSVVVGSCSDTRLLRQVRGRGGFVASILTPLLPQPVKFLAWKMDGRTCKQYIFQFYNTSAFNALHFDENPFTCQSKKKTERLKGFKFHTFNCCFQVTSRQWRG